MPSCRRPAGRDTLLAGVIFLWSAGTAPHTVTRETVKIDNVYYIDTGAAYGKDGYDDAKLTIVEVHPERHREHSMRADALSSDT